MHQFSFVCTCSWVRIKSMNRYSLHDCNGYESGAVGFNIWLAGVYAAFVMYDTQGIVIYWKDAFSTYVALPLQQALLSVIQRYALIWGPFFLVCHFWVFVVWRCTYETVRRDN